MNKEAKAAWLEALRSGRYKQGKHKLRTEDSKFCCLGVLCDLGVKRDWSRTNDGWWCYGGSAEFLPEAVRKAARLDNSDVLSTLVAMNDGEGKTFAEIADWIEANL